MPPRTNPFQRLIRYIHEQMVPVGWKVYESAMLREVGTSSAGEREIDILLEGEVCGYPVRIAIECRDHTRPASIQWIDSLDGKFRNLPVHRVIAVSRSGFSKSAYASAKVRKIETKTLSEALSEDWPGLARLAMAEVSFEFRSPPTARLEFSPPYRGRVDYSDVVEAADGRSGTFGELMAEVQRHVVEGWKVHVSSRLTDYFRTRGDVEDKFLAGAYRFEFPVDVHWTSPSGKRHTLVAATFDLEARPKATEIPVTRTSYLDSLITSGKLQIGEFQGTEVHVVQTKGKKEGRVFFGPRSPRRKK